MLFSFRKSLISAGFVALFAFGCLTALTIGPSQAAVATSPVPGTGIDSLGGGLVNFSNPGAYSLVIGDTSVASTLAGLPGRALAYFAATDVNVNWSTGVPYSQASANGWLLTDSSGNLLVNQGYANDYVGDVGSSGYQQAWITNVLAFLSAHPGIDGVFIDDVLFDLKPLAGTEAAKYPTQQQWAAATLSFVTAVGNALRAKGYYVGVSASGYVPNDPNSNSEANTVTWWQELAPYVDGLMTEYYQETPTGTDQLRTTGSSWDQNWDGWQRLVAVTQSLGKDFIGLTYGPAADSAQATYGKASFLLEWNGGGSVFVYATDNGSDPANAAWTTDIGQPTAAKQQVGVGWQRTYSGGIALVNPSPSTSQTFQLGGSYRTASGAVVTSLSLAPTSAAILTSVTPPAGTTTAAPPPATTTTTSSTTPPPAATTTTTTATTTTTPPPATTTTRTTTTTAPTPTVSGVTTAPPTTTTTTTATTSSTPTTTTTASSPAPATTTTAATTTTTKTTTTPHTKAPPRPRRHTVYTLASGLSASKTTASLHKSTARTTKHVLRKTSRRSVKHTHARSGSTGVRTMH